MSSPLDREFGADEPSPYAPKWVREAIEGRRGGNPERSPPAATEEEPKLPGILDTEPLRSTAIRVGGAKDAPAASESVIIDRYRLPPSLEPTVMAEPWAVPGARSGLGLTIRFSIAAGIAALLAVFIVGKFPISFISGKADLQQPSPSFGSRFSGQNAKPVEAVKPATAQLIETQELPGERVDRSPLHGTATRSIDTGSVQAVATTASPPVVPSAVPVPATPAPARAEPQAPAAPVATNSEARAPAAPVPTNAEAPAPAAPAKSFVRRQLDREEIAALIRRGDAFISSGDLASARLVLQRAAEAGDPSAALKLAGTYDPIVLEKSGIQGFGSDIAAARTWYERAKEFGSAEAMRRLEMLASRMQ